MNSISLLGVDLTEAEFPNLYPIAAKNKEYVAGWLLSLTERTGSDDLASTAVVLEHDLEHERLAEKPGKPEEPSIVDDNMIGFFDLLARFDYEDKIEKGREALNEEWA